MKTEIKKTLNVERGTSNVELRASTRSHTFSVQRSTFDVRRWTFLLLLFACVSVADAFVAKTNSQIDTLVSTCPGTWSLTSQRCGDIGKTVKACLPQTWNTLYSNFQANGTSDERGFAATLFTAGEWNGQAAPVLGFWQQVLTYPTRTPLSTDMLPAVDPASGATYQYPVSSLGSGGGGATEQTAGDANVTWNTSTVLRRTTALTVNRTVTLPAANSVSAGTVRLYLDALTGSTVAFGAGFIPAGSDLLNGDTATVTPFLGGGTVRFESNGSNAWQQLDNRGSAILNLQDGTDPSKQGSFILSGVTTGQNRAMTWPDVASWTPAVINQAATFLQIGGSGSAPTVVYGTGAGTTPTGTSVTGNNSKGLITFTTGSDPATGGAIVFTATYANAYPGGSVPRVSFTPHGVNAASGIAKVYISSETNAAFVMSVVTSGLQASTQYIFSYQAIY